MTKVVRVLFDRGCCVRDVHREDAAAGAQGEFPQFNRNRPIDAWQDGPVDRGVIGNTRQGGVGVLVFSRSFKSLRAL